LEVKSIQDQAFLLR